MAGALCEERHCVRRIAPPVRIPCDPGDMDDDAVRTFLGSLPRRGSGISMHTRINRPAADGDVDLAAVDSWVERNGGEVRRSRHTSKALVGGGMWQKPPSVDTSHYLIPVGALEPDAG